MRLSLSVCVCGAAISRAARRAATDLHFEGPLDRLKLHARGRLVLGPRVEVGKHERPTERLGDHGRLNEAYVLIVWPRLKVWE